MHLLLSYLEVFSYLLIGLSKERGSGGQRKQDLDLRVGTWNIGILEVKSLELANELSKYRIHVACVQETRCKGQKVKGIKGYKLWYAGLDGRRNGVDILVSNDILKQLVEVRRCNDRIMLVRIVVGEEIISIVSGVGYRDAHPTQAFSTGLQDEEENRREEGRVQGKDHVGETQRGYSHNPVKQDNKFIGPPNSVRGCE
ncbi:uncharacterized protein LOC130805703 [Amaranthus tricolor]|uniref:uncharacterized protein LOC130805703 n=1 Tax=Amaranthus tricolor TaxID=29722 RepID=UPI0025868226|nr:uncharacterized protein LOC130805703 [Amaranthus tricolor]